MVDSIISKLLINEAGILRDFNMLNEDWVESTKTVTEGEVARSLAVYNDLTKKINEPTLFSSISGISSIHQICS